MKNCKNEFEDLPGIELGIEVIPKQQARQKVAIELNSGKPSFDLFNFATTSDGKVNTLPIPCDTFMINYNQELLAKKDIPVPKTLDEMMAAAAAINDPAA